MKRNGNGAQTHEGVRGTEGMRQQNTKGSVRVSARRYEANTRTTEQAGMRTKYTCLALCVDGGLAHIFVGEFQGM